MYPTRRTKSGLMKKIFLSAGVISSLLVGSLSFNAPSGTSKCGQKSAFGIKQPLSVQGKGHRSSHQCGSPMVGAVRRPFFGTTREESHTQLSSLKSLVEDIESSRKSDGPRVVFVGGKGGVGKTSISSALAVSLASNYEKPRRVLIVSTDPAHSLGDALEEDLRGMHGRPRTLTDPLTSGMLSACEVDAAAALDDFRSSLEAFDIERLAGSLGVSSEMLESFGLQEFSGLLNNPPPGLDELVALSNVLNADSNYDVVIVDTAPTGHTIRLLALPQFLDGLLGKLIRLRMKLSGLANTLQAFLGSSEAQERAQTIDNAMDKLEIFRNRMANFRASLQNPEKTSFVVVSIPTKVSIAESKRLVADLDSQGVSVTDVVMNQCVGDMGAESSDAMQNYYQRRSEGQKLWIGQLQQALKQVSSSREYKENGDAKPIGLTKIPFFDVELVGVPALSFLANQCFVDNENFSHLIATSNKGSESKVVICGGKGGVGKTTSSCALAVSMAEQGHKVALISTDPAHSVGDVLDMSFAGGNLQDCPLYSLSPTEGSLSVMEVDPSKALSEFSGVVKELVGKAGVDGAGDNEVANTLRDFGQVFDTLPAGTDEVVALAKVINLVKKGGFDRIVLDTAPTGHTLRMLSTPSFLAELIDRVLSLAEKVTSNSMVQMMIGNAAGGAENADELGGAASAAKSQLLNFQFRMYELEDLLCDPDQTEFVTVTIPTELAVKESIRLVNDLTFESPDMAIKVRNVIVNQVLKEDGSDVESFLGQVRDSQQTAIANLEGAIRSMRNPPRVSRAQYLDTEPKGVYGLQVLGAELLREEEQQEAVMNAA